MHRNRLLVVWMALAVFVFLPAWAAAQSPKKIVFVAGPKDHGGPGAHEYTRDLEALKGCFDASNVKGLEISVVQGAVPDPSVLAGADAVVMESSGDRYEQERHVLFPFDGKTDHQTYDAETTKRLAAFDALARKGLGVVVLHYATYVNNNTARRYFLDWVGGYYESGYSRTVVTEWNAKPINTTHPIMRGVTPWTFRDEFYIALRTPEDKRRTSLLTVTPTNDTRMPAVPAAMVPLGGAPLTEPALVPESLVSWAIERDGGGRGFVMSGVHSHANLANDSYRRFLLNGILWAAKGDIPAGGVVCALPAAKPAP